MRYLQLYSVKPIPHHIRRYQVLKHIQDDSLNLTPDYKIELSEKTQLILAKCPIKNLLS